jgi:YbbR domain-containing protein
MRLPGFATRNVRLKGLAAALATILWAGVAYASNPPDTRSVTVPVPQDTGSVTPYVLVHAIPDLVVRVSGTRDHLAAFNPSDIVVNVDYKAISHVGVQQLPISIVNNDRDVALDSTPSVITANVDRLDSRAVPVFVDYGRNPPPQGYVVVNPTTTPSSVTVIGPHNQLAGVQARVTVNLASQKTNFQADEPVLLYDTRTGQRLNTFGLSITVAGHAQATVLVNIEIAASLTSRASAVLPKVSGSVGAGHFLLAESVFPATVVLAGPQDLLNALDSVATEAISVNGITGTLSFSVNLMPPAGVTANPTRVTVTITVGSIPQPPSPAPTAAPTTPPTPTPSPT